MLYKRELINSFETIGYSCCIMMSIVIGPKWSFYSCWDYIGLLGTGFMQVLYLGRAPSTKETLPDFCEKCRVTRHSRVFRRLTGSQRTPRFGASQLLSLLHGDTISLPLGEEFPFPYHGLIVKG